jgi:ankyrin repeat protein
MTLPVASLKILVEQGGAFVNQVDQDGDSALKIAASMDDAECVEYLLKVGADVFHSEGHNGTALHAAAARGSASCCRLLLAHRASPSVIAGPYHSVIQAAASSGNVATMKLILEADPHLDVNLQGGEYGSPLHAAAMQTDSRCLKMLLEKGARADIVTGEHGSVIQLAAFTGCNRNVKILIEHGVDVNTVCGKQGTALQAAALKCETSTLQALLDAGAKLEVDDGKNTPQSKKNGKYGSALAAAAARVEIEPLELLLAQEGWSTGATGAYRQALVTAAKYNRHGSFRIIVRSKGGKTIPKKIKSSLRKEIKKRDQEDDGDDNSDFGDDVVYNEQDPDGEDEEDDDEDDEEEEENEKEEEEAENGTTAPSVPATQENVGPTGERGLTDSGPVSTNNGYGNTGYGPPPGYPQAPAPAGNASQPFGSGSTQRGLDKQQQDFTTSGLIQSYGQTARSLEDKPQYQAYSANSAPPTSAYQAYNGNTQPASGGLRRKPLATHRYSGIQNRESPRPSMYGNTPDASTGAQAFQQTARNATPPHNSSLGYQAPPPEPSYGASNNIVPSYSTQSAPFYGSRDPAQYNSYPSNSHAAPPVPPRPYAAPGYAPPPPQQQSRGFESQPAHYSSSDAYRAVSTQPRSSGSNMGGYAAVGGALAGGVGGYALAEEATDPHLAYGEPEEEEHAEEAAEEETEHEEEEATEEAEEAEEEEEAVEEPAEEEEAEEDASAGYQQSYDQSGYGGGYGGYDRY